MGLVRQRQGEYLADNHEQYKTTRFTVDIYNNKFIKNGTRIYQNNIFHILLMHE